MREALASAVPAERKVPTREAPALGPWMLVIRAWLLADRAAPRKQRHTARRVHERLVAEYGATVAESTVRAFVARVHFELDNTLGLVTVPQTHGPGEEAEVDFGEFSAYIDGALVKCQMFCMRLSHSGRGFHVAFSHQAQEAFLEGHVLAFAHFSAVPHRIRYDNLKAAVDQGAVGSRPPGERALHRPAFALFLRLVLLPSRASRAVTRRAAWKARWDAFAVVISCPCRWWRRWPN